jgi:SAM-dependent methyltransferase
VLSVCSKSYWDDVASSFAALGPPLKPSDEDIDFLEEAVAAWAREHPRERHSATLLGVTRQIAEMRWPETWSLLAIDQSLPMAQIIWPGDIPGKRWAICGDWLDLPRGAASSAVVIGDGSANCVKFPEGLRELAENIRRVMRPDGILLLRCFVQPEVKERPEDVFSDLVGLRVASFHHFKFRLLMAMQRRSSEGIVLHDVYEEWMKNRIDEEWLAERTGWEARGIGTIHNYRDKGSVHTFPTLSEFRTVLHEYFDEVAISIPTYSTGERCPRLMLRQR